MGPMTRFELVFVWVGGALFVGSLALWVWWYALALGRSQPWSGWPSIAFDTIPVSYTHLTLPTIYSV